MDNSKLNGKTAILYARASTQEQSTKVQIEQLKEFCNNQQIKVLKVFSENISGAKEHREQLETILENDAMADLLIIREISRISRERDYLAAINKISTLSKKYSIYVLMDDYYIEKGEVIDLGTGITMMVKLYGAADEREKIIGRTTTAKLKYMENPINVYTGHKYIPFGLMKVDNPDFVKGVNTKKIWVKNPAEWDMVEKIFDLKCNGYSLVKISQITGISYNIVLETLENPKILYYMPDEVKIKAKEATEKNKSCPTPTKHINIYKNKIFIKDTNLAMTHQVSKANGSQYRAKKGESGTVKERVITEVVKRTLIAMFEFFHIKKQELSKENEAKSETLKIEAMGLMQTFIELTKKEDELNKKFIKAPNETVEKMIVEDLEKVGNEKKNIGLRVATIRDEINRLRNIDYSSKKVVIDDSTLPEYIDRYIRRIECWHEMHYHHNIKVYVKPEFIPSNFFDYKEYHIRTYKTTTIQELRIPEAVQTLCENGFFWDLKVFSLTNKPESK